MASGPPILDHLALLTDATRSRLLLLLERQELTVSELCTVLQSPQSTISRQLKTLGSHGWLARRPEGARAFYAMDLSKLGSTERRMWLLLRDQVAATQSAKEDEARLESVLRARHSRSQEFFSTTAEDWDRLRRELFGSRFDSLSLLGLLDARWTVGDLGCGTGEVCAALAPFVDRVVGVDRSRAMLRAARARCAGETGVDLRLGDLESLPIEDNELAAATLMLVLHHTADPNKVIREAARALRPGGVLLIADAMAHDREEYRQQMGHVWMGFEEKPILRFLEEAGFTANRYLPQPADPQARGPRLFVATGRLPGAPEDEEPFAEARAAKPQVYAGMPE